VPSHRNRATLANKQVYMVRAAPVRAEACRLSILTISLLQRSLNRFGQSLFGTFNKVHLACQQPRHGSDPVAFRLSDSWVTRGLLNHSGTDLLISIHGDRIDTHVQQLKHPFQRGSNPMPPNPSAASRVGQHCLEHLQGCLRELQELAQKDRGKHTYIDQCSQHICETSHPKQPACVSPPCQRFLRPANRLCSSAM
jgi:hypothetical protein